MKPMKHLVSLLIFIFLLGLAAQTQAQISTAALLYLRIAPGSRAAGIGEAFVAVADDATATHWNPAGLGASPLAGNWETISIPGKLRPVSEIAAVKVRGGSGYSAYDIWAISRENSLVRFDGHNWFTFELFSTRTDQTVQGIVQNYFNLQDGDLLQAATKQVIIENSDRTFEQVETFQTKVLEAAGEDYKNRDKLVSVFDSLLVAYSECRVNWSKYSEAEKEFNSGMSDSSLTESEIDKINFAVEKSRSRFIPEELKVSYFSLFSGDITALGTVDDVLIVGTENGLYSFNGKSWRAYDSEDGLRSKKITAIASTSSVAFIGTDVGLHRFNGNSIESNVGYPGELPDGEVTAIGASSSVNIWVMIENDLYRYDGQRWQNSYTYTVSVDDNLEAIAEKIAVYGTATEKETIIAKIKELYAAEPFDYSMYENTNTDSAAVETIDRAGHSGNLLGGSSDVDLFKDAVAEAMDTTAVDTSTVADTAAMEEEAVAEEAEPVENEAPKELVIEPGMQIQVPYAVGFKGDVNVLYPSSTNELWVGTEHGLLSFTSLNGSATWKSPGYKTVAVAEGQTLTDVAGEHPFVGKSTEGTIEQLKVYNELDSEDLTGISSLKVYSNPTANSINDVERVGVGVSIATDHGVYELNQSVLNQVDEGDMGTANVLYVDKKGAELWYMSDNTISVKAKGASEVAVMFAKWLPQLADDMYYAFMTAVTSIDGLGTVGISLNYITYGTVVRTGEGSPEELGTFEPFDFAIAASYGTSLMDKLKGGVSVRFIYSHLSEIGAGVEVGEGTSTGLAVDLGLLYQMSPRFNLGLAITNLGPDITYIDADQSDPLPRNLALGFMYKLKSTEYYHMLVTAEINKSLVSANDGFSEEIKEAVINGGGEFMYNNIFAARVGYIYDQVGDIKSFTVGFGVSPINDLFFDFAYIPSGTDAPLANTLRTTLKYKW
ncbi:MAG: hypothetical protein DWP97_03010 [Calditrichaeota bacterium]|nr:MAG: hypothetical protein DWP97_03010 [Calditrichota bacterium]